MSFPRSDYSACREEGLSTTKEAFQGGDLINRVHDRVHDHGPGHGPDHGPDPKPDHGCGRGPDPGHGHNHDHGRKAFQAVAGSCSCSAPTSEPAEDRRFAVCEALEQCDLQLFRDPQGSLDAGHGVQLRDQLGPARVVAGVGEDDQA